MNTIALRNAPGIAHRMESPVSARGQVRKPMVAAMLFVLVLASFQNFAGIFAAILLAVLSGEFRDGRLRFDGFVGAFYVITFYAIARMLMPSSVPIGGQLEEVLRVFGFAMFAAFAMRLRARELLWALTAYLVLTAALYPIYLMTSFFAVTDFIGNRRFAGLMIHANHLGYVSASMAISLAYLRIARGYAFKRLWAVVALALILVVASRSSGAFLTAIAGFGLIPLSIRMSVRTLAVTVFAAVVLAALLLSPIGQNAIEKLVTFDPRTVMTRASRHAFGAQGSSFAWRMSYWLAIFSAQVESGTFYILFGQGGGSSAEGTRVFSFMTKDTHSDVMRVFLSFGVVGVMVIFGSLVTAVVRSRAILVASVVFFVPMLAGNSLFSSPVLFALVLLCIVLGKIPDRPLE